MLVYGLLQHLVEDLASVPGDGLSPFHGSRGGAEKRHHMVEVVRVEVAGSLSHSFFQLVDRYIPDSAIPGVGEELVGLG